MGLLGGGGGPVSDVELRETYFVRLPGAGVVEVRLGRAANGVEVFATVGEPRRWFVIHRAADMPDGILGQLVWEVDPGTGVGALRRRMRGSQDAAPVLAGHQDLLLRTTRAAAEDGS